MNLLPFGKIGSLSEATMQDQLIRLLVKRKFHHANSHWQGSNADVYSEVHISEVSRRSDIIVKITPRKIINIECKLENYTEVLAQAKDHLRWADYSYICIHHSAYIPNYILDKIIKQGIGLIYWVADDQFVEVIQGMKNKYADKRIKESVKKVLDKKQQKMTGLMESKNQSEIDGF